LLLRHGSGAGPVHGRKFFGFEAQVQHPYRGAIYLTYLPAVSPPANLHCPFRAKNRMLETIKKFFLLIFSAQLWRRHQVVATGVSPLWESDDHRGSKSRPERVPHLRCSVFTTSEPTCSRTWLLPVGSSSLRMPTNPQSS